MRRTRPTPTRAARSKPACDRHRLRSLCRRGDSACRHVFDICKRLYDFDKCDYGNLNYSKRRTGTSTFGALNTNSLSGISLTGTNFTFSGAVTTTALGPFTLVNSATAALSNPFTLSGAFNQSGGGSVNLETSIATSNAQIHFTNPVSLTGSSSLNSSGGSIVFDSTINGGNDLVLTPGAGTVTLTGAVGGSTRVGTLTFANGSTISTNAITASSIIQSAGSGTSTFGALNTNSLSGISLTGTNFTFSGAVTTTALGPFTLVNSASAALSNPFTLSGAFNQSGGGSVNLETSISTSNAQIHFTNPVSLTGSSSLNSSGGSIVFDSTINGGNDLVLTPGAGTVTLTGAVGGSTRVGTLTFANGSTISTNAITANSIIQSAGSGTSTFGALNTNSLSGISLTGTNFTFSGAVTTTALGPFTLVNSGIATLLNPFSLDGEFSQSGAGSVQLGTSIDVSNAQISFNSPITLAANSSLVSNGGNISIHDTIQGPYTLNINSGLGNSYLYGEIGESGSPILSLTTAGTATHLFANITASGSTLHFTSPVVLESTLTLTDTGSGITFDSTIFDTPLFTHSLTLDASTAGQITASNLIIIGSLQSTSYGNSTFDTVLCSGSVGLTSNHGNLSVGTVSSTNSNISLKPSSQTFANYLSPGDLMPEGVLTLHGNLTALSGTITLSDISLPGVLSVAGIQGTTNLGITAQSIVLGQYATFTVFGNLTMTASTGNISVTDVIATNNLTISAPSGSVQIYLHDSAQIYDSYGVLYTTPRTNIVSSSNASTSVSPQSFVGPGPAANIGNVSYTTAQFQSLLSYSTYSLDFNESTLPPPPPPPPAPPAPPATGSQNKSARTFYDRAMAEAFEIWNQELLGPYLDDASLPVFWTPSWKPQKIPTLSIDLENERSEHNLPLLRTRVD